MASAERYLAARCCGWRLEASGTIGVSGTRQVPRRLGATVEAGQRVPDTPHRRHVRRSAEQPQRHHDRNERRQRAVTEQRLDDRRQAADDAEIEQPLGTLHRADVDRHPERLAARPGVADHDRAQRGDQGDVDGPAVPVVDGQAAEHHQLRVAIHHAVEEGAALGHHAGGTSDAAIEDVEDAGQQVEPAAGAEVAEREGDTREAGGHERGEGERVGRHTPAHQRALPRAEDPHHIVAEVAAKQLRGGAAGDLGVHSDADPACAEREQSQSDDEVRRESEQRIQRHIHGMHP